MVCLKALALLLGVAAAAPAPNVPQAVPNKFIVTLKSTTDKTQVDSHVSWARDVHRRSLSRRDTSGVDKVWTSSFKGYSGEFDDATIEEIKNSDDVLAVEPVMAWELYDYVTQEDTPWGLGSISHRDANHDTYTYDDSAGEGMWAYVVDTGLYTEHEQFEGRGYLGYNAYPGVDFEDNHGHGTHCAGIIASKDYGVSKKAKIMSVKVFDTGSSTTEIVLDGYEWAVTNITNTPGRTEKSVVSMSLGGPKSDAFNLAVETAFDQGVLTVVAAGNSYSDVKYYSPASAPSAVTIGAVDVANTKPSWSNYGTGVDIFAPGVSVLSTWIGSPDATNSISGTSMACPHISGLSIYLRALEGLTSAADVTSRLIELATLDVVESRGTGSPNRLAFNGASS